MSPVATKDYKSPSPRSSGRSGSSMLVGIVIGLVVGLAIALGVAIYLFKMPEPFKPVDQARKLEPIPPPKPPAAQKSPSSTPENAGKPDAAGAAPGKSDFDFYGILAGKEQQVKESEVPRAADTRPEGGKPAGAYFLQVGAFQNAADADNLKAKLALAGFEAQIQTAVLADDKTWHRVRLGPYQSVESMEPVKARLKENHMEASLIKVQEKRAP